MPVFEADVIVDAPAESVFEFLTQPECLRLISPPEMGLKFLDAPVQYHHGCEIYFVVQAMGQVQKIRHRVTCFESPTHFTEELIEGPLRKWIHTHDFVEEAGKTRIVDRIEFQPPGGLMGLLLTENRILDQLDDAFYHRHQQLLKHF